MKTALRELGLDEKTIEAKFSWADTNTKKEVGDVGLAHVDTEVVLQEGKTERNYIDGLKVMALLAMNLPANDKIKYLRDVIGKIRQSNKQN